MSKAYRDAGVDIDAGDELVERIKPAVRSTTRPEVIGGIGGFGGLFALGAKYRDPVLVSGTDGVGTKLLVAQAAGRHTTIGVDLVAMCVNDIAVLGAEPLFFLDYFATGKLDPSSAAEVVEGIAAGCREAGCALLGGETAEMPGMYAPGHYDLAGFTVGVVERDAIVDGSTIAVGDALVGLPSSGVHSNGYSLVRRVLLERAALPLDADPGGLGCTLADELLRPTRIYVRDLLVIAAAGALKGAAHITGGGIVGNVPRMLPAGCGAVLDRARWSMPPVFELLRREGELSDDDMLRTFNCGLGMVVAVAPERAEAVAAAHGGSVVGEVVADVDGAVVVR
jgi:phosphoribosylformylglycinamidine cyclo-ligase